MNPGRKLLSRQLAFGVLLVLALGISVFYTYTRAGVPTRVYAAPASTLNFQARLMGSSGAIVADGSYSVAFNLYNDPLTGASQWTETQAVTVKSGYLSVYLGSSSAFPSTIDWSQSQYLTMNVNGDGEMNPRLKLTAVPFAFQAATALAVKSFDTNALSTHSSDVSISTGDALGLTSNSGNLTIDTGNATGTTGAITIGGGYASSLTLGRSGLQTTMAGNALVQGGSLALGTTGQAGSLQISDGSSNTVTLTASGVGTDYNLTLPTTAPAVDQCLRTNSSTASQLEFGACGTRKVQQSYTAYGVNQAANATTALNYFFPTTTTTFNLTTALSAEVKMSRAGSFRSCSIYSSAAVTAGSVSVHFRKNGADISATNYCTLSTTNTRSIAQDIDPGIVTFNAGDTIGVALVSTGLTPATLEHRVDFTVEFGTGSDSGIYKLQDAYNNSSAVELGVDSVRGGLTVRDNIISIGSNLLEVQNNNGSTTYFGVSATGVTSANTLTVQSGGISSSGGFNNNNGAITNAGSITGVGTDITGSGALTLASGGAGALTLDSASNTLVIAATDTTLLRTAAGTYTINLADGSDTLLALTNTGAGLAGMTIEGGLSVGSGSLSINSSGDVTSAFTLLNGATTTNGTSGAGTSTALIVTNATNFDIGNYVQVNAANCGGTGINPCYAKITNKVGNTLTITPALRWTNGVAVNEYHVPEIGGTDTTQALANRYGRGYFISGVAAGNGTTFYNEDGITTSLTSFDLLNTGVATLNIGGEATAITLGTSSTAVNVAGSLNVAGTSVIGSGGALTNIASISGAAAMTISSGAGGDLTLDSASGKLVIAANDTSIERVAAGVYTVNLSDAADTTFALSNSGTGAANLNIVDGSLQIAGTTVLDNARVLQNVTIDAGLITGGTLSATRGGTGVNGSGATNGQLLIGNGTGFSLGSLSNSGGLTITPGSGTLGLAVAYGSGANTAVQGNTGLTVSAGTGLTGGSTITLGSGGTATLNVAYGSTSTTAVRGDTALVCPTGSGNLSGGGTSITLGSGGTCAAISTIANPSFATSVSSPLFTSAGATQLSSTGANALTLTSGSGTINIGATSLVATAGLSLTSGGAGDLTLDAGSNKLVIAANDTTLQRTAIGSYTIDLNDGGNTTLVLNNTGLGAASLNLSDGTLQVGGTSVLSNTRAFSNLTGIASSGTIQLSTLAAGGLVKADTSGNLAVAVAGTDYESPLTFTSGLTRTTNTVRLGGNLGQATDIGLNGNALTITGSGGSIFTAFAAGGIDIRNDSTAAMAVRNAAGTRSYLTVNTTGNMVQVGSSTTDAVAILKVLDSYNGATDPTGVNGASYYNSVSNKDRCYEDGYWTDCVTQGIIGETTLAAANTTINVTLSKAYESLECRLESKGRTAAAGIFLRFNNVAVANNYTWNLYSIQTTAVTDAQSTGDTEIQLNSTNTGTVPFNADVKVSNFSDIRKGVEWSANSVEAAGTNPQRYSGAGMFTLTGGQITSVQFIANGSTFIAGSHAWCMGRNVR